MFCANWRLQRREEFSGLEKRREEFKSSLSLKSKVASRGGEEGLSEGVSSSSR